MPNAKKDLVIESILSLVPNWYRAEDGPERFELDIGDEAITFFAPRNLTPEMWNLKNYAEEQSSLLLDFAHKFPSAIAVDLIQEYLALKWLKIHFPWVNWEKALSYFRELSERTYENARITKHIMITQDEGSCDITEPDNNKVIDVLGSSPHCYFCVDGQLNFVDYKEIKWSQITEVSEYSFHPEFLHPFYSILSDEQVSLHLTSQRDVIIMCKGPGVSSGVIAAKRKGRWKLYNTATLKNCLSDILGDYRIGCNIYELILDLSFRRHGALLIFDPQEKISEKIVNPHAKLTEISGDSVVGGAHSILKNSLCEINPSDWGPESSKARRLFVELASVDGALIFSHNRIIAFGAMIKTHEEAKGQYGARTTAALSAYLYGGHPIKISSDGDVNILFTSKGKDKNAYRANLSFA